mmetsp:Transcript_41020/g.112883  ORF Transcript_41020/g.112883 Transcript_41020/m.112883 type:complete len:119 (+) Transcript_41020:35-391(+)
MTLYWNTFLSVTRCLGEHAELYSCVVLARDEGFDVLTRRARGFAQGLELLGRSVCPPCVSAASSQFFVQLYPTQGVRLCGEFVRSLSFGFLSATIARPYAASDFRMPHLVRRAGGFGI